MMGKGVIVSHLGDGHYRIGLDIDVSYARNQLLAIQTYLDEFAPKYQEATEAKDAAKAALTPINDRLTDYLAAGQAASQAAYDAMVAAYDAYIAALQDQPDPVLLSSLRDIMSDAQGLIISTGDNLVDNMLAPDDETGYTVYRVLTPFDVASNDASNTISAKDHGYNDDEVVLFEEWSEDVGLTLDACDPLLDPVNKYYIVNATTSAFEVSLTPGGDPVPLLPPYTEEQEIWGNDKELDVDTSGSRLLQKNTDVVDGDKVRFSDFSDDLGVALEVAHYVVNANDRDFRIATTPGGTPLTWPDAETIIEQIGWTDFSAKLANFGSLIQDEAHGLSNGTRVTFSAFADSAPLGTPAEAAKAAMSSASSSVTSRRNDLLANLEIYGTDRLYSLWTTVNCYLSNDGQYVIRNNHKLENGTRVQFSPFLNPNDGSVYNTGIVSGADYYVVQAQADYFYISTSPGGLPETMTRHTGARRQSDMHWEDPEAGDYDKLEASIVDLESAQTTWLTLANPTSNLAIIAAKATARDNKLAQAMAALDAFLVDFSQPHYDAMLAAWETYQDARGDWVSAVEDGVPVEPIETGIVVGDEYFVINADADTYQIATTLGGPPVEIVEKWPRAQFYLRNSGSLCYKKDHGLTENQPVRWLPFFDDRFVTFDTGVVPGTVYYAVNVTTDEFQLAETPSGTPIAIIEQAGGAMRSSTMFYRDETYVSSPRDAGGQWYDETEETVFVPRYAIMSVFDRIEVITTERTGIARHLNEVGDIDVWTEAIPPAGLAEVDWWSLIAASVVDNEPSILAAQDSMLDGRAQYEGAYNTYVTAYLAGDPNANDYRIAALSWKEEYETRLSDWLALVEDNSGDNLLAARMKDYEAATEAFNKARQDLGKLLGSGGLPEELAAILADQEKAYADYHAALANWADMTLIKTEKEKLFAELNGRLLPYFESNIEGLVETSQPKRQEVNAWCCDATEDLGPGAEVATIEIPGERDLAVRVRPGYESRETYAAERDGILQPSWASSPEATYWNWALHPGNARWHPNYRLGEILLIDAQAGTCTVQLDQQTNSARSKARDGSVLDVNNPIKYQIDSVGGEQTVILPGDNVIVDGGITTLTDVEIEYMECNADAFEVGDHVMVEFQGRDWTQPKVIGFAESPRPCVTHGLVLSANVPGGASEYLSLADTPNGTLGVLKHANGLTSGGNIDWTSSDGKTVVTWMGPPGRAIATQILPGNVPMPSGFSGDSVGARYRVRLKFDSATTQSPVDPVFTITQHYGNTIWINGRTTVNAPAGCNVLGAAICESGAKKYLVAVWSGVLNGADLKPHEANLAAFDVLEHPTIADHVFAFAPITGTTPGAWTILHTEPLSASGDVFPPIGAYFFSASGTKCAACVPTLVEDSVTYGDTFQLPYYGIGNDLIIRAEFIPGPDGVTLAAPTIQRQTAQASSYLYSYIFNGTGGPDSGPWSFEYSETEDNNSSAIMAVDFDGEAEVNLSGSSSFSQSITSSGAGVSDQFAPEGDYGSRGINELQQVTWSITDSSRAILCDYSYTRNRAWGEDWSFSGGLAWSGSDNQSVASSVRRLYYYDLRNGAAIYHVANGDRAYSDSHSGTITTPGEGPRLSNGTETGSVLALFEDREGGAHGGASASASEDYTTNEGFTPYYYGAGVSASINDTASGGKAGESVCNLARAEYQTEWAELMMPPRAVYRLPTIAVQRCNPEGDIVGRIDYRAFPRVDAVIDAGQFRPFNAEREHGWDTAFCTAFDLDTAWQNHLDQYHAAEGPPTGTAAEGDMTPLFRR